MTLPLARLQKYGLAAPGADDVKSSVAAVDYRNFTKNWNTACESAGVSPHANLLSLEQMRALAAALSNLDGAVSLMGHALAIRIESYEELAALEDDERQASDPARRIFEDLVRTRVPDGAVVHEIYSLDLFSPENKQKLDDAARSAATALKADLGLINVMLGGAQSCVGQYGPLGWIANVGGTPIEWAFCATTVRREKPYVISNAQEDVMQRSNPFVAFGDIRCYAGVPLVATNGLVIGSVCAIGTEPKDFNEVEIDKLNEIGAALIDDLTAVRDSRVLRVQ